MNRLAALKEEIKELGSAQKAKSSAWFFQTGVGQYGYGDQFIGLTVPEQRSLAKKYSNLSLQRINTLIQSEIHEERLIALFILVDQFEKGDEKIKKKIFDLYLANTKYINNWDLVDSSAHKIVGRYLLNKDTKLLDQLAKSDLLWERRVAMIATAAFIADGKYEETLRIAEILVNDKHDLIQKAVGWMLREVGKRCGREILEQFLAKHYKTMPRTALRYAIEHFSQEVRKRYLSGVI